MTKRINKHKLPYIITIPWWVIPPIKDIRKARDGVLRLGRKLGIAGEDGIRWSVSGKTDGKKSEVGHISLAFWFKTKAEWMRAVSVMKKQSKFRVVVPKNIEAAKRIKIYHRVKE